MGGPSTGDLGGLIQRADSAVEDPLFDGSNARRVVGTPVLGALRQDDLQELVVLVGLPPREGDVER